MLVSVRHRIARHQSAVAGDVCGEYRGQLRLTGEIRDAGSLPIRAQRDVQSLRDNSSRWKSLQSLIEDRDGRFSVASGYRGAAMGRASTVSIAARGDAVLGARGRGCTVGRSSQLRPERLFARSSDRH